MRYTFRKSLSLGLAVCLLAGMTGCGAAARPTDEWHLGPPESAESSGVATAPDSGDSTTAADTTGPETGTSDSTTVGETTGSKKSTTRTTRTTKAVAPPDDPQRPKEEEKEEEPETPVSTLPDVTLPPSTTAGTTTTTTKGTVTTVTGSAGTTASTAPPTTSPPPSTGWHTAGGQTYYYLNGKKLTGYQDIGKAKYYFDKDGALSSKVGIDVSTYQGDINWNQVKADGVDFAFIRLGARGWGTAGTMFTDAKYEANMKGSIAAGVDRGVYFFSQAINVAEAKEEAQYVLDRIKGYAVTYPVVIDMENPPDKEARTQALVGKKTLCTDIAIAFCDAIKAAGYYPMVYAGASWATSNMEPARLKEKYDIWLAQYNTTVTYPVPYTIWQYTSKGAVAGIAGNIDRNIGLKDYAKIIRDGGWNHLK